MEVNRESRRGWEAKCERGDLVLVVPEGRGGVEHRLLGEVEHFADVLEVPGAALHAGLDLLIVVHDGHDGVHGGVVHLVHLVAHQDDGLRVILP